MLQGITRGYKGVQGKLLRVSILRWYLKKTWGVVIYWDRLQVLSVITILMQQYKRYYIHVLRGDELLWVGELMYEDLRREITCSSSSRR